MNCLPKPISHGAIPEHLTPQAPGPVRPNFQKVAIDIAAERLADAVIEAEEKWGELQTRFTDLRALKPATAALIFGSEENWKDALSRVGVATGRALSALEAARARAGQALNIEQVGRPIAAGSRVQWTGD